MKKLLTISILLIYSINHFGQTPDSIKMNSLIVYGDDFTFMVKEPDNWIGDIDNASKYYSNIIFYKSLEDLNSGGTLIQVLVFKKHDENTIEDLKYDVNSNKEKYKNLEEKELIVKHENFKCFSKLVYKENNFYQYISYINPGEKFKNGLSVSMNISKREATEKELQAYKSIIESLWFIK